MTEDEFDELVAQLRKDLQPVLRRNLPAIDFNELNNPTQPTQYGSLPIFLVYHDFYYWLAANNPQLRADFENTRRLFRAARRAFLGTGTTSSVTDQLDRLKRLQPGRALMNAIGSRPHKIFIVPDFYSQVSGNNDVGGHPFSLPDATSVGMPILWAGRNAAEHAEDPWPSALSHATTGSGTGVGTDYTLNYSPELYGRQGALHESYPGSDPDQMLFHELVHALRAVMGVTYSSPTNQHYDNEEEYLAIVLTNIYMSSQGAVTFRGDHYAGILQRPDQFLDNVQQVDMGPRMLLERFRLTQPDFFRDLAQITSGIARFNPVRQYNDELKAGISAAGQRRP